jgi:hypothetical protein
VAVTRYTVAVAGRPPYEEGDTVYWNWIDAYNMADAVRLMGPLDVTVWRWEDDGEPTVAYRAT